MAGLAALRWGGGAGRRVRGSADAAARTSAHLAPAVAPGRPALVGGTVAESWVDSDGHTWAYEMQSSRATIRLLEVGGQGVAWRCTVLPPDNHVDGQPCRRDDSATRQRRVVPAWGARGGGSSDRATEGLLRYATREDAVTAADELARSHPAAWLVTHRADGSPEQVAALP